MGNPSAHRSLWWALAIVSVALGGCALPEQRADFRSNDPQERTLAAARAARTEDHREIPRLIELLDSPDPGERMLAIGVLEHLTGETFGFEYWAPERERQEAVSRWVIWRGSDPSQDGSIGEGEPTGDKSAVGASSGRSP